jgi:hypothetical protein
MSHDGLVCIAIIVSVIFIAGFAAVGAGWTIRRDI